MSSTRGRRGATALALGLAGVLALPGTAFADNVVNNVTVNVTDTIVTGGSTTVGYRINATGGDGNPGCNVSTANAATVVLGVPAGVTASATQLRFTTCNVFQNVTFASTTPGSHPVSVTSVSGGTGSYTVNADFTLRVLPPADATPPVITPTVTGTLGNDGWYTSDVDLTWSVTDAESAASAGPGCVSVSVTSDQAAMTYTCAATSAGGSASRSVTIQRDATAPTVEQADVEADGWHRAVSRAFTATDAGSGLADAADGSFTLVADAESDAADQLTTATRVVSDAAGNLTVRSLSARIDTSAPVISGEDVVDTQWRNAPLSADFTATDARSGLAAAADAAFTLSTSGEGEQTVTRTVTDAVGNTAVRSLSARVDLGAPTVRVTGPVAGATYLSGNVPTVGCDGSDALSGLDSSPAAASSLVDGRQTVTCTATDRAGNTAQDSVSFRVLVLGGFSKNFDGTGVPRAKAGSSIPLGWAFREGTATVSPLTRVAVSSAAVTGSCTDAGGITGAEQAEVTAGGSGLQLLPDGSYQANWKSGTQTGCRRVTVRMYTGPAESDLLATRSVNVDFTR